MPLQQFEQVRFLPLMTVWPFLVPNVKKKDRNKRCGQHTSRAVDVTCPLGRLERATQGQHVFSQFVSSDRNSKLMFEHLLPAPV